MYLLERAPHRPGHRRGTRHMHWSSVSPPRADRGHCRDGSSSRRGIEDSTRDDPHPQSRGGTASRSGCSCSHSCTARAHRDNSDRLGCLVREGSLPSCVGRSRRLARSPQGGPGVSRVARHDRTGTELGYPHRTGGTVRWVQWMGGKRRTAKDRRGDSRQDLQTPGQHLRPGWTPEARPRPR